MFTHDAKIWTVIFEYDAAVNHWHDMDSVEWVGNQRVKVKANILCEKKEMAKLYIEMEFADRNVKILSVEREVKLQAVLITQWFEPMDAGENIGDMVPRNKK